MPVQPWMVSLHGGHSSHACDHAHSTLEEMLEAALNRGFCVFGVTEHAPRVEESRVFPEERALGWNAEILDRLFTENIKRFDLLRERYAGKITLLKGMEIETVPVGRYAGVMNELRQRHAIEYIVGSVHFVEGHIIDYVKEEYEKAIEVCGGPERLAVRYYQTVAEMALALRPEVVGHFDLVRKWVTDDNACAIPAIRQAAFEALDVVRETGGILDINLAGYRRGFGHPYPSPWLLEAAHGMGIPFCFGDDSHSVAQVGDRMEDARDYLLSHGVTEITVLEPEAGCLARKTVALT